VPWRARDYVHCWVRRRASRPQLKHDPLGAMRAALCVLGYLIICSVGCHHGPSTLDRCPGEALGATLPRVGAESHLEVTRSTRSDSLLASASVGQLVTRIRWSNDSLARVSRPVGAVLDLMQLRTHAHNTAYFDLDNVPTQGLLERVLRAPAGDYSLKIRRIGTASFDTTFTVRRGFSDTALMYLQSGGARVCY